MLGTKPPTASESRLEWWRRQISRQQSAGVPVAEFCRQLGVTSRMFYYWKERVRAGLGASSTRRLSPEGLPRRTGAGTATNFLPVSILAPAADAQLEIELSNACVVRVKGVIDPSLLRAAIAAAAQVDGPGRGGC